MMSMVAVATERDVWIRLYRLGFGAIGLAAVIYQLDRAPNWLNFFSFFTIQSNVIAGIVLLIGAFFVPEASRRWDLIRGGAAIYMILTGVIYNTLLTGFEDTLMTPVPWVNNVLHRLIPIVMLLDLLIVPVAHRIRWREATVWTVYPLLYLCYSLVRGPFVDWYPYPFLDPRRDGGYGQVFVFSCVTLVGFLAVTWLITELNAWRLRQHRA